MPTAPADVRILWVDFETTGADPATCLPLELAAALTDGFGRVIDSWGPFLWRYPRFLRDALGVWEGHTLSGLSEECFSLDPAVASGVLEPLGLGELQAGFILQTSDVPTVDCWLGGRNVHFDRALLKRFLPVVESLLSYRHMDTGVLERALDMAQPHGSELPHIVSTHRAAADVREAVETYRWFLKSFERAAP